MKKDFFAKIITLLSLLLKFTIVVNAQSEFDQKFKEVSVFSLEIKEVSDFNLPDAKATLVFKNLTKGPLFIHKNSIEKIKFSKSFVSKSGQMETTSDSASIDDLIDQPNGKKHREKRDMILIPAGNELVEVIPVFKTRDLFDSSIKVSTDAEIITLQAYILGLGVYQPGEEDGLVDLLIRYDVLMSPVFELSK